VTSGAASSVIWTATAETEGNTAIDVSPTTFSLDVAANRQLDIQARLLISGESGWRFASVTLTPDDGNIPNVVLPVVFFADGGVSGDLLFDNLESGDTGSWSALVE
jgi:hypothetical protein